MTSIFNVSKFMVGTFIMILLIYPVMAAPDYTPIPADNLMNTLPSNLPLDIPEGIGTRGEDGNLHVNLVDTSFQTPVYGNNQGFNPMQMVGSYQDKTEKSTKGVDGTLFKGGADIDYTVAPDNTVSGTVAYKFIEQGWTIKVKGTVEGKVTPDGVLSLTSHDANVKYAGANYPISMNVNAQYNGDRFEGTKVISAAGVTGTLGFSAGKAA